MQVFNLQGTDINNPWTKNIEVVEDDSTIYGPGYFRASGGYAVRGPRDGSVIRNLTIRDVHFKLDASPWGTLFNLPNVKDIHFINCQFEGPDPSSPSTDLLSFSGSGVVEDCRFFGLHPHPTDTKIHRDVAAVAPKPNETIIFKHCLFHQSTVSGNIILLSGFGTQQGTLIVENCLFDGMSEPIKVDSRISVMDALIVRNNIFNGYAREPVKTGNVGSVLQMSNNILNDEEAARAWLSGSAPEPAPEPEPMPEPTPEPVPEPTPDQVTGQDLEAAVDALRQEIKKALDNTTDLLLSKTAELQAQVDSKENAGHTHVANVNVTLQ